MVAVPFVYFMLLLCYYYRKAGNKIDLATFIVLIYAVSGFFSILIDVYHLRSSDTLNYNISLTATFMYCLLLTMCILPIARVSSKANIKITPISNDRILKILAWVAFIYFVFDLYMNISVLYTVLTGDLADIRELVYQKEFESAWINKIDSAFLRLPFIFLNFSLGCFWILIFLAFYSLFVQKMPRSYFYLFLFSSLKYVVASLLLAGRSAVSYWFLAFIMCYILFRNFISEKEKRNIMKNILPFAIIGVMYFFALSTGRFSQKNYGDEISGTQGGLISYMGQSFINFCYFWDTFQSPVYYWQDIFPFTNFLLRTPIDGGTAVNEALSSQTNIQVGVFYTFIGNIKIATSNLVAIIYCIVLYLSGTCFLVNKHYWSIKDVFVLLFFSSILILGVFTHFYMVAHMTFSVIFFYFLFNYLSKKSFSVRR